ncbi:MAG: DNA-binding protein [Deltaproteobacteria bacterium]|nr:MAG: DNA-binding protein [Deltaproteobacteria bacterium]
MDQDKGYLTVEEVAKELNLSPSWVYRKVQAGIIPHVRIGAVVRFVRQDVERWIEAHKVKGCLKV